MAQSDEDIVVFNMPDGTRISNDPRFDPDEDAGEVQGPPGPEPTRTDGGGGDESGSTDYSEMTAKELKAEAETRGIDISGMTKKSELVAALEADDAEG